MNSTGGNTNELHQGEIVTINDSGACLAWFARNDCNQGRVLYATKAVPPHGNLIDVLASTT